MSLYSCTHAGDDYRITKLDENLVAQSTYRVSLNACECPSFERRNRCRHIDMLPRFIHRGHVGAEWLHDFERNGWERNPFAAELPPNHSALTGDSIGHMAASGRPLRRL